MNKNKKGRGAAYSNEYQSIKKETTVVKVSRIHEGTLDAVTGKLRNRLCYGGPNNLRHISVNFV